MSYFNPGQDDTTSTTALLQEHYANSFASPNIPPTLLYGKSIGGIARVEGIIGTHRQGFLFAEGAPPVFQTPGDNPSGQVLGQDEYLIARHNEYITATHQMARSETYYTPEGLRRTSRFAEIHRRMLDGERDRRLARAVCLGARSAAATSQGQFIHAGGTVNSVTGIAGSTAAAVLLARYPLSTTGANNAYGDLSTLADQLDRKNAPRGVGQRPLWVTVDMYNALTQKDDAKLFSRDYLPEGSGSGNNVQRREVEMVLGFTIMGGKGSLPDLETGSSVGYNGGIFPATNVTTGPTALQGNFLPTSTGTPACFGAHTTPGNVPVVEYWEEEEIMNVFTDDLRTKIMEWHSACMFQCGIANPSGAYSIELKN